MLVNYVKIKANPEPLLTKTTGI